MAKSPSCSWWKLAVIAIGVAVPAAVAGSYLLSWIQRPPESDQPLMAAQSQGGLMQNTPFIWPGIRMPVTVPAHEAEIKDDESIIGVYAGGKHRAYRVKAMVRMTEHVINDLVGDVPVTVTYDERTDTSQVFTCDMTGRPMDVEMGGYFNGMLLRNERRMIRQATGRYMAKPGEEGEQALAVFPHTRTDWKSWRTTFPNTDAYVGQEPNFKR